MFFKKVLFFVMKMGYDGSDGCDDDDNDDDGDDDNDDDCDLINRIMVSIILMMINNLSLKLRTFYKSHIFHMHSYMYK